MSDNSSIEWTDATWNPIRGCSKVSPGCTHCYAMHVAARFSGSGQPYEGLARRNPTNWTGDVRFVHANASDPLRWRRPRRVFVNSMSDFFHEGVPRQWQDDLFGVMSLCPQHTFQILTKRADVMRDYMTTGSTRRRVAETRTRFFAHASSGESDIVWPLPNVWLGASIENQEYADARLPHLVATPAAVRFVSYEPALGPIDWSRWMREMEIFRDADQCGSDLDWIICGGESGQGARPCDVAWIRSAVEQCRDAGVACFTKQLGKRPFVAEIDDSDGWPEGTNMRGTPEGWIAELRDPKGGDPSEWPEDLRVREYPEVHHAG